MLCASPSCFSVLAAYADIKAWPPSQPNTVLVLPLLGDLIEVVLPPEDSDMPLLAPATVSFKSTRATWVTGVAGGGCGVAHAAVRARAERAGRAGACRRGQS